MLHRGKSVEMHCRVSEYQNVTASGLPFQYKLKVGRNGRFTKELWVDRREDSKSLAWSSVKLAFHSLYDAEAETSQENIECMESMKHTDYTDQTDQAEGTRIRKYHYNKKLVLRPKALGDIRGISYIYALFYRFELIEVPEKSRQAACVQQQLIRRKIFILEEHWIMRFLMETRW